MLANLWRYTNMVNKKNIAYCGLDCSKCDAMIATLNNDDILREKTAKLWTEVNGVEITKEMINCLGCCGVGVKTPFCDNLCEIRKCSMAKGYSNCGECILLGECETIKMIISSNNEALNNLSKK